MARGWALGDWAKSIRSPSRPHPIDIPSFSFAVHVCGLDRMASIFPVAAITSSGVTPRVPHGALSTAHSRPLAGGDCRLHSLPEGRISCQCLSRRTAPYRRTLRQPGPSTCCSSCSCWCRKYHKALSLWTLLVRAWNAAPIHRLRPLGACVHAWLAAWRNAARVYTVTCDRSFGLDSVDDPILHFHLHVSRSFHFTEQDLSSPPSLNFLNLLHGCRPCLSSRNYPPHLSSLRLQPSFPSLRRSRLTMYSLHGSFAGFRLQSPL